MGCFLACFGFKEKKKRRKPGKKVLSEEQDHRSYVPLDSDVSIKFDIKENITSDSNHLEEKPKEPAIVKIKKKVRFNLNVKAYEPIPNDDEMGMYLSEGEDETKWEFNKGTKSTTTLHYEEEDAIASSIWSYPPGHRYENCRDSYDEEDDELKLEENDLNFDELEDSDDEEVDDIYSDENVDVMPSQEDFPWELNPVKSDNAAIDNHIPEAKSTSLDYLLDSQKKELQGLESKSNARDRSKYVSSVLNPVENLSQWKVIKAKSAKPQLKRQKENLMSKQDGRTIAVDASLSNWLSSLETQTTTKNCCSGI